MRRVVRALLQRGGHDLELQVRSAGRVPTTGHDASVELIVTPDRVIDRRAARGPRPRGEIHWAD
jgi:5-formyltetrahydrofolate cyclo-ligase